MAKPITNRQGQVLMKHKGTGNTAWMSERTLAHHRKAGWTLASDKDDQPDSAGDAGTPPGGPDTDNPKGTNA